MWFSGMNLDLAALASVVPACAQMVLIKLGRTLHGYSIKVYPNKEITLVNSLVDMYSKWNLDSAKIIFEGRAERTIVSWTSVISGYTQTDGLKNQWHYLGLWNQRSSHLIYML